VKGNMVLDKIVDAASKMGNKVAQPQPSEAAGLKAKTDQIKQYTDAVSGKQDTPKAPPAAQDFDKINPKAKYGDRPGEKRPDATGMPQYKDGTTNVPKTGAAKLHKGEAVIPAKENPMNPDKKMFDMVPGMGKPPKKELDHIRLRKANGGHIVEHHHKAPFEGKEHMKEHVMSDMSAVHDHLENVMGQPNEGEEAGNSPAMPAGE
jgi:hypothetical protein